MLVGLGMMGLKIVFIGCVVVDLLGLFYVEQIEVMGMVFVNLLVVGDVLLILCLIIFVMLDGEWLMNIYLGVFGDFGLDDVNLVMFSGVDWLFLEGYLFDKDVGKVVFLKVVEVCYKVGGQVGIVLLDLFCVDCYCDGFCCFVVGLMDYVIGNFYEWILLYQVEDLEEVLCLVVVDCCMVICICLGEDVILICEGEWVSVFVYCVVLVDVIGVGDQFVVGLIYGLVWDLLLVVVGCMGCIVVVEVIGYVGLCLESDLLVVFCVEGLIC